MDAIYIHIPFCNSLCNYCDFLSFAGTLPEERKRYVDYLIKEISLYDKYHYDTVYFGGGTPSILEVEDLDRILKALNISENAEVTLEVNPRSVNLKKLIELKKIGFNRLSIGIQSFNDEHLKVLGRYHTSKIGVETYLDAREAGFDNISLDLMFSLPNETLDELKSDLEELFKLNPEHFSIYSLIWEENTPFFEKLKEGVLQETDNDLEADMFELIISESNKHGYSHYEISNFAKKGYNSRHNSKYWESVEYLGVGLGASGYLDSKRYKNLTDFTEYYNAIESGVKPVNSSEVEYVDEEGRESYRNMLGLRLLEVGIKPSSKSLGKFIELEERGLLTKVGENYILSKRGIMIANDVFEELI